MTVAEAHKHEFNIKSTVKVKLRDHRQDVPKAERGAIVGVDTLKVHKCACGAMTAYDLERLLA